MFILALDEADIEIYVDIVLARGWKHLGKSLSIANAIVVYLFSRDSRLAIVTSIIYLDVF